MDVYQPLHNPAALSIFIFTLFLPIFIGLLTQKQSQNQADFLLAGRKLNKFVVALSAVSSGRSSWLVLGFSGLAYQMGLRAVWAVVGYILIELFQFI